MSHDTPALVADGLRLSYGQRTIVDDLSVRIPRGGFTAIIGANGCGKSTLLRALGRMITPRAGRVLLDGEDIATMRPKRIARRIGMLAQSSTTPQAVTVGDLVARGRNPHQGLLQRWSDVDEQAVDDALREVGLRELSDRPVEELSGGQRQRVWIAMVLAQQTSVLLLDEPTTYLDVAHQIEVLDLCSRLHRDGRTLVAVLHDLNLTARYATHVIAMRDGAIVARGTPQQTLTRETLRAVFDFDAVIGVDPETGGPLVIPRDNRTSRDGHTTSAHPRAEQEH